jgi:hypothetical protein
MSTYEEISVGLSVLALLISIVSSIVISYKSGKSNGIANNALSESEKANRVSMGGIELTISDKIESSQDRLSSVIEKLIPLSSRNKRSELNEDESKLLAHYQRVLKSAMESNVNAYEEACTKYLDEKIDKDRFKKSYFKSIENLVKSDEYKDFLGASHFVASNNYSRLLC